MDSLLFRLVVPMIATKVEGQTKVDPSCEKYNLGGLRNRKIKCVKIIGNRVGT